MSSPQTSALPQTDVVRSGALPTRTDVCVARNWPECSGQIDNDTNRLTLAHITDYMITTTIQGDCGYYYYSSTGLRAPISGSSKV